jgi:hypothetical protein
MKSWSDRPFAGEVPRDQVARQGRSLGMNGGEAHVVYEIANHPGWVAKLYKQSMLSLEADSLRKLIELPGSMSDNDLARVDTCTAWPTARIVENDETVGVVMAKAPDHFFVQFRLRGGRVGAAEVLPIDWLIGDEANLARQDIRIPGADLRQRIAGEFLAVGELFERYNLIYGDWSYRNSLWSPGDGQIFLLDMDSSRLSRRRWVESPEWEDPLNPVSTRKPLDCYNDRYKLAVLAVRCITGERGDPIEALHRLPARLRSSEFEATLCTALTASSAQQRPTAGELLKALRSRPAAHLYTVPAGSNVTGQRPVRRSAGGTGRPGDKTRPAAGRPDPKTPSSPAGSGSRSPGPGSRRPNPATRPSARSGNTYGSTASRTYSPYVRQGARSGAGATVALIVFMVIIAIIVLIVLI